MIPASCPLHPLPDQFFNENLFTLHLLDPVRNIFLHFFALGDEYLPEGARPPLNL
jgi:hypothetical protein